MAFIGAFTSAGVLAADIPSLNSRVTDQANILGPETRRRVTEALTTHADANGEQMARVTNPTPARGRLTEAWTANESATGNKIAVLTTPTLAGEPVERYANRVFAAWKLGRKGKDDGVLVVVARATTRCASRSAMGSSRCSPMRPRIASCASTWRRHSRPVTTRAASPLASPRSSRGWAAARLISKRTMSGPWRRPTRANRRLKGRQTRRRFP